VHINIVGYLKKTVEEGSVDTDPIPDPPYHFHADPDPTFLTDAEPDPAPY
jgi:hypothetical protein